MSKIKKENKEKSPDKSTLDRQSLLMIICIGCMFLSLIVFLVYYGYATTKLIRTLNEMSYEVSAPDFSSLEARPSAVNSTEKTEGTIGYDAYYELRKTETREGLEKVRGLIGDKLYVQYLNGLDTDYYKQSVEYDYDELLSNMDEMLKEAGLMEALYNSYALDNEMPAYTECYNSDCELLNFIESYTKDDLHTYLRERHDMWESILQVEKERTNVSDSYLNLFYQDEVCQNLDYIDKIQVEVLLLTKEQYELGMEELQSLYDDGKLTTQIFDETNKNYFNAIRLYRDIDFYDGTFKDLTVDTFNSIFASDVLENTTYLMGGEDVATVSDANESLINKIKDIKPPTNVEEKDYTKLENWNTETFSLTNRNEDDILYLLWKIVPGSCEHTLKIPAKSSILSELEDKAKWYLADRTISDTIYAELNDLTTSEVYDLLKENYGYTDEELGSLTEEELLEDIRAMQERDSKEESQSLEDIKEHLKEDGYENIDDMTDEEILEIYNAGHNGDN